MFAISNSPYFDSLVPAEKLFLESWFNLTHPRSLDSYRVRCHNGRTVLEELKREIELKIANAEDFGVILSEAKLLCEGDAVLQKILVGNYAILHDLLSKLPGKCDSKEVLFSSKEWARLGFVLEDILPLLEKGYARDVGTSRGGSRKIGSGVCTCNGGTSHVRFRDVHAHWGERVAQVPDRELQVPEAERPLSGR